MMAEKFTPMNITEVQHKDLINILDELIVTIKLMNPNNRIYFLNQNLREAKDWRRFLKAHTDKEELLSLEEEISERLFYKYDANALEDRSELDDKRRNLMHEYLGKSFEYIYGYKYKSDVLPHPLSEAEYISFWEELLQNK
ncbi:MAG: hypothetical protein J1F11_08515 [Oscillospiraceae bacterium]|nr:hypothetical protein [Oscillospiraceae bacterium]